MIEITRHEKDGVLQGFSFFSHESIMLVVFTGKVLHSVTSYRGNCDVGAPGANCQAVAFPDMAQAETFIAEEGLVSEGAHEFHELEKQFQVFLNKDNALRLSEEVPEMGMYRKANNINLYREPDGRYFYVDYFEPGHRELLEGTAGGEAYATVTPKS